MGRKRPKSWASQDSVLDPIREHRGKSRILFSINLVLLVVGLACLGILLWLRIDWGFREWIHQMTFYNFWNGTYVMITAALLLSINCIVGVWTVSKHSVKGLIACPRGLTLTCLPCLA